MWYVYVCRGRSWLGGSMKEGGALWLGVFGRGRQLVEPRLVLLLSFGLGLAGVCLDVRW